MVGRPASRRADGQGYRRSCPGGRTFGSARCEQLCSACGGQALSCPI